MPGPPKKSDAEKHAAGTARRDRVTGSVVEWPHVSEVPEPPDWLTAEAGRELWGEMTPHLFTQRVMTIADVESFAHLCQLHGEIVDGYRRRVKPTASELNQLRMLFTEFGMTPASRTRVKTDPNGSNGNQFARNGKKRS